LHYNNDDIMKNHRLITVTIWAITFAIYFIVRYGLGLSPVWEAAAKLLPEIVLLVAILVNRKQIVEAEGIKKTILPVSLALVFSMIGDTAGEMKVGDMATIAFACQILFFIFAHICYMCSYFSHSDLKNRKKRKNAPKDRRFIAAFIIIFYLAAIAGKVFVAIESPVFMVACGLYLVALFGLGISTTVQDRDEKWFYVLGAMFFIFSDSIIALNTFVSPVPQSGLLIMSTYFIAQLLLNYPLIPKKK